MAAADLTAERLRELLSSDPMTGVFIRLVRTGPTVHVGDIAGGRNSEGYWCVRVDGKRYLAHRLIWLYFHGEWPLGQIDHIDGCRSHNAISNLRLATKSENLQNINKAHIDSQSGILGVHWDKRGQRWVAQLMLRGKWVHISRHTTKQAAEAAYLAAKAKFHPFSQGRRA